MSPHLGADLAALVDGELDHPSRERVLRHLTRCPDCRTEVGAQRRFKDSLRSVACTPAPTADLAARLRALAMTEPVPEALPASRRRVPLVALGGVAVALGLGAVLALAGPHRAPARVPPDPGTLLVDDPGGPNAPQLAGVGGSSR